MLKLTEPLKVVHSRLLLASGGQKATTTLNQTAGDPFIEVNPTTIDVPQDGSAVQVTVDTNTTFTVTSKA